MKRYLMCSGGKDSMASIIIAYENHIKLDGIVIAEVMFDHKRNISGEHPLHSNWLHNVAIPTIENIFGYKVILIKSNKDYISIFNERISCRSKNFNRIGMKKGFPLASGCIMRRELKIIPIEKWCKQQGEFEKILGLAYDEKERLFNMHKRKNERSLLEEYHIFENDTFDICRKYNLLSPYYDLGLKRQGCWFCPNCSIKTFAKFEKDYPHLWNELRMLSQDKEIVSTNFKYDFTFFQIDNQITLLNSQISLFDLYKF